MSNNKSQDQSQSKLEKPQPDAIEREDGLMIGNMDKEGEYPFDPEWKKHVVVRHVKVDRVGSSKEFAEISSSIRIAVYEVPVFEALKKNGGFEGVQVRVIHKP